MKSRLTTLSASLWGCELKFVDLWGETEGGKVSLLVRLWVEILLISLHWFQARSASLWGCELKCQIIHTRTQIIKVSLLVRLWVEIRPCGCGRMPQRCQPPCEAVSWNGTVSCMAGSPHLSASLWGCELKYITRLRKKLEAAVSLLVRLWVEIHYTPS